MNTKIEASAIPEAEENTAISSEDCSKCGAPTGEDYNYCTNCGERTRLDCLHCHHYLSPNGHRYCEARRRNKTKQTPQSSFREGQSDA